VVEDLAEAPGQEKLDALMGDEVAVSKKCQNLVPEDELGLIGVDVRDGMPRLVREEDAASDLASHDGQRFLALQEKQSKNSLRQTSQTIREKPASGTPQSK